MSTSWAGETGNATVKDWAKAGESTQTARAAAKPTSPLPIPFTSPWVNPTESPVLSSCELE